MVASDRSGVLIDIEKEITLLRKVPVFGQFLANALIRLQDGANNIATQVGVDVFNTIPSLPPIQAVNVSSDGSNLVHVTITHNLPTQKNLKYFLEVASNPGFANALPEDLGSSRQRVLSLPQGTYYIRGYHQASGSLPSKPVNYGGEVPTSVVINTGSSVSLLASTGSGTAAPDGSQPGQGLGKFLYRPALGPKRRAVS